ncbi:hypothetical protein GCM10010472_69710 [Pseudonocardia halophobica]|uniref:Uncharacterized protein n=1 Tax=Pseudonocardia halophobica TaxID=29401 RepID=A0A9W6NXD5_9PSEU|nr:hypothetical protein [Pseudonocardia halophobica]GLL12372.1 hypothetical protein GCM10017577_35130 [Pseudonocardia halophobica]
MPTSTQSHPRNTNAHTDPQAESATTSEARASGPQQERPTGPEPGPSVDRTAAELGERWREMAVQTGTAMQEAARHNQDAATRAAHALLELTLQLNPLALLGGAARSVGTIDAGPPSGARTVVDEGFRMAEAALATQRGYVDQLITAQRRISAQMVTAGESLAARAG